MKYTQSKFKHIQRCFTSTGDVLPLLLNETNLTLKIFHTDQSESTKSVLTNIV